MKRKTHKFLLCENPVNNKNLELYIYSTRKGKRALFEVKTIEISDLFDVPDSDHVYTVYFVSKDTGLPKFHELTVFDNQDIPDHKISVVLKDAGKWYKNYLIWAERQIFKGTSKEPFLKDCNYKVKGLKIIYSEYAGKWVVIFRGKIMIFESEEKVFSRLSSELNVDENYFTDGIINRV